MTRGGVHPRAVRRARIFALTKGFYWRRKSCYSIAARAAEKAMQKMYIGRKMKKREFRQLWINRINIAAHEHNINYSRFITGLAMADVQVNRKVLSELAIHEPRTFQTPGFRGLSTLARAEHTHAQQGLRLLLK